MVNNTTNTRESLIAELADLVDRAIALGRDETMTRIRQAVAEEPAPLPKKQEGKPLTPSSPGNGSAPVRYGGIKNAIRLSVAKKKGLTRKQLTASSSQIFGQQLTKAQIGEGLRTLSRDDEVVSRDRKWFPGPNLDREKLGI